ncbi:MAG: PAC2 family protein, partial [Actinobacteria bacterium]|nr:PAC2 family protein [Actinomycetota bacterium]
GAERFARLDSDEYFDFQETRPTIRLVEGRTRAVEWPTVEIWAARAPRAPRDLIIVSGPEPSMRWRGFCSALLELSEALGVQMAVTVGAMLADVPHTRPVPLVGLASDDSLIDPATLSPTSYEGPTGITGVVYSTFQDAGIPSVSVWASVPHYVAAAPNPKASLALVRKIESIVGVSLDASALESAAADYERRVTQAVAGDEDVRRFVERLEEASDAEQPDLGDEDVPSGDVLASEFQRFLNQRGDAPSGGAG